MWGLLSDVWWRLRLNFYLVLPSEIAFPHGSPLPTLVIDAVPLFFLLMAVESLVVRRRLPPSLHYHLSDFLCSWMAGGLQQLFELLCELAGMRCVIAAYSLVYKHCRLVDINVQDHPVAVFFALMFGVDFFYYWFHRSVHEYHTLWALGHSVHHTGEFYNMSTALRQGMLQSVTAWPFYLPLALVFPPATFLAHLQLNALYQIWPHTELVGRLGILEYILQTPSAHRMHHRPPGNCNYGGVFIIWDKMFGTFVPETIRQDWYGLAGQPQTFGVVQLNGYHFQKMVAGLKGSFFSKLLARRVPAQWTFDPLAVFCPLPALIGTPPEVPRRRKYEGSKDTRKSLRLLAGVGAISVGYTTLLLTYAGAFSRLQSTLLIGASASLLYAASSFLDGAVVAAGWGSGVGLLVIAGALGSSLPTSLQAV